MSAQVLDLEDRERWLGDPRDNGARVERVPAPGNAISPSHFIETETIRRFVRNAETNNMATLDEARNLLKAPTKNADQPAPKP